ncbi:MAG: lipopolysaccharide biosynthesis protein [Methylococcales bacterium]
MNNRTVEQRAARVAAVTGLSTAITMGLQLISVPVCLHYWGKATYGVWLALFSVFTLFRTIDAGFTAFVGNKINFLFHRNSAEMREALASSVWGCLLIGTIESTLCFLLLIFGESPRVLGVSAASVGNSALDWSLVVLVGAWALTGPYLGIVQRLLVPAGMMYQAAWWGMAYQVSQFLLIMGAAVLEASIFQASVVFSLAQAGIYIASGLYVRYKMFAFYPAWRDAKLSVGMRDLWRSMLLTFANLLQQGTNSGFVILLATVSGVMAVPAFTTVRTMANLWNTLASVITTPLLPDVVRYHAASDGAKLIAIQKAHWFLAGTAVNLSILLLFPFIEYAYGYWTARQLVLDKSLLCALLGGVTFANLGGLINIYLNGINRTRDVLAIAIVRGGLALGLGVFLLPGNGPVGLGIAIVVGEFVGTLVLGYYFFSREIFYLGSKLSGQTIGPIVISTSSVLLYLLLQAVGVGWNLGLQILALSGVVFGAWFGWRTLERETKIRFMRMAGLTPA